MEGPRRHLTYANVMSTLAVVLVIGGGAAYAANTIGSSDIIDGQVKSADIGQGAVATDEIANGQVKAADIGAGEVRSGNVANDNLTGGDVAPNALKGADIDESTLSSIGGGGPAGGDLTGIYPNPEIAANAVRGAEVANGSLGGADIRNVAGGSDDVNADLLDGLDSTAYQRRVNDFCDEGAAIDQINMDGGVGCTQAVWPIARTLASGGLSSFVHGDLLIEASCRQTYLRFTNIASSAGTLNWQFSEGTSSSATVNASGTVIPPDGNLFFSYGNTGRLEGQWIFSTPGSVTTLILHAFQGEDFCEVSGTALVAGL